MQNVRGSEPPEEKCIDLQSQVIYVGSFFSKKSLHVLEDSASSLQVDTLNT